jgi:hypothetical protein
MFEYLDDHCNLYLLKLSYITVLISLKLALKCAHKVSGLYNPRLLFSWVLGLLFFVCFVFYPQNTLTNSLLQRTMKVIGVGSEDRVSCFVFLTWSLLTNLLWGTKERHSAFLFWLPVSVPGEHGGHGGVEAVWRDVSRQHFQIPTCNFISSVMLQSLLAPFFCCC